MELEIVTLEQLQKLVEELNKLGIFDPPIKVDVDEENIDLLIKDIKECAAHLEKEDIISEDSKKVLKEFECGPWYEKKEQTVENIESVEQTLPLIEEKKQIGPIEQLLPLEIPRFFRHRVVKDPNYTRFHAFADAIRQGATTEKRLIKKAQDLYTQHNCSTASKFSAIETHRHAFSTLRALDLLTMKQGRITVKKVRKEKVGTQKRTFYRKLWKRKVTKNFE